ncbi:ABC transporter ATP-binding protein/permease [Nostoc sp. CHAB 5715]|uniref:ABC transporter ATP-binding protein/permease n=1 Tax=Nostoc sp. CHAB 5715 TaxID=2780400 RepID=UPI001E2D9218|nr:ABC transporter ATP-binding protein/permease [Nostoc sp. CHAB 5715]MCC5622449.1 ABC transporter ATP-binding protein/permease [Nostoc sp. CHAB 5715]
MLNFQIWQQFRQIIQPYWFNQLRWGVIFQLLLLVAFSLGSSTFVIFETLQRGELTSSLAQHNVNRFQQAIGFFFSIIIVNIIFISGKNYIQGKLSLDWRKCLTSYYLNQYFTKQSFYHLQAFSEVDNPDQRMAEDVKNVTQRLILVLVMCLDSLVQLIGFIGVLWFISPILMITLLAYAVVGTLITTLVFGRALVGINLEQLKREADFRYGLVRIRDNAEAIAFYEGQAEESAQMKQRFGRVFANINRLIRWQFNLNVFQNGYQYLTFILPFIILAPRIFDGELELGAVTQSQAAFERVGFALGLIITQFDQLSALTAGIRRLTELTTKIEKITSFQPDSGIQLIEETYIAVNHLTLQLPDRQTKLIQDLSITILPGQSLLIVGASGVGKTSLLRAIAGFWVEGEGTIARPAPDRILFLPQRPYMPWGTLGQQLLYPHTEKAIAKETLLQTLHQVHLPDLADRYGGLDAFVDWSWVLSLGEQQRLAFARLLLSEPSYAILDEATSALDEETAASLYQKLQETSITYISVGHRSQLLNYHQFVLELRQQQECLLFSTKDYEKRENLPKSLN